MRGILQQCLIFLYFVIPLFGYKILVFAPTISRSHMISNGRIADALAKAGHEVVLFEPDFLGIFDKVDNARVATKRPIFGFTPALWAPINEWSKRAFDKSSMYEERKIWYDYGHAYNINCQELIRIPGLLAEMREEKFDAYFGEQLNPCGSAFAHAIGIKRHFWISSCPVMDHMIDIFGAPPALSYIPSFAGVYFSSEFNLMDRLYNHVSFYANVLLERLNSNELTQMFRDELGPDFPHIDTILRDTDLVFINTDELLDIPRPEMPNWVHVGGLGLNDQKSTQELSEPLKEAIAKGKDGFVYFSMGTNANTTSVPKEFMRNVIDAFKKFPSVQFIVKVDAYDKVSEAAANSVDNVFITHWTPQQILLQEDRLLAFISHGGYNSLQEAAVAGVPLICIPFFGDQYKNGIHIAGQGWGISLDRFELLESPKVLEKTLQRILSDKSFKEKAQRVSKLLLSKPFSAEERLVRNTEFVIQNGGLPELQVKSAFIHPFILHGWDITLIVLAPIFLLIVVITYVCTRRKHCDMKQKVE